MTGSLLTEVRRLLRQLTRRERFAFWALVAARGLSSILDMAGILLLGLLTVAAASSFADEGETLTVAGFTLPRFGESEIVWLAVIALTVFVVKALIALALTRTLTRLVARIELRNATRIAEFMFAGALERLQRIPQADLQYALTGAMTYAFTGALNNVSIVVSETFLLVVLTATFFAVDPVAAIFTLLYFAIVVVVVQLFIGRTLKRAGRAVAEGTVSTMDAVTSTINAFRELTVLRKNDVFVERVTAERWRVARSDSTMALLAVTPRYVIETALILGVVLLVGQQFLTGQLVTGMATVAVFLAGGVRLMASLMPMQNALGNVKQQLERARPGLELLDSIQDAPADAPTGPALATHPTEASNAAPAAVAFDRVSYRYPGAESDVLRSVTLDVEPGSYAAVIGPSGAGKTTLVDVLLGLVPPTAGTVTVDGVPPVAFRVARPGSVAYVPQKPGIVTGTIAQNVALGVVDADIDRARVAEVLEAAFLAEFVDALPAGVDTMLGTEGTTLSGGQVQRIGLARALYSRPRLLVLDEATSGLDATSEAFVARTIAALHGEVTLVVIAHRLSTVQHADVVHFMQSGEVRASGDLKTLRESVPAVAEYVRLMSIEP